MNDNYDIRLLTSNDGPTIKNSIISEHNNDANVPSTGSYFSRLIK